MDEGDGINRWVAGLYYLDDSYRISSGSAFADNTLFKISQSSEVEIRGHVSASAFSSSVGFSGSFEGDGSGLTGLPAAGASAAGRDGELQFVSGSSLSGSNGITFNSASMATTVSGSLSVTGSLLITGSLGTTNSNVLKLKGSGSISGSGLFEIQGSTTTLFSVTDDLTDELFAANDASGLSIISAFADRTVKLGKPGGFGIVISGSDPMPTDLDANIIITGSVFQTGSFNLSSSITISETGSGHFSGSFEGDGSRLSGISAGATDLDGLTDVEIGSGADATFSIFMANGAKAIAIR